MTARTSPRRPVLHWLRVLLAALMIPLVTLAAQSSATADGLNSGWEGASVKIDGAKFGYPSVTCWAAFRTVAGATFAEAANGECIGGVDLSPGFAQPGEAGSKVTVWTAGPGCAVTGPSDGDPGGYSEEAVLTDHPKNNFTTTAGYMPELMQWPTGGTTDCEVTHACFMLDDGASSRYGCDSIILEDVEPDEVCEYGTPVLAKARHAQRPGFALYYPDITGTVVLDHVVSPTWETRLFTDSIHRTSRGGPGGGNGTWSGDTWTDQWDNYANNSSSGTQWTFNGMWLIFGGTNVVANRTGAGLTPFRTPGNSFDNFVPGQTVESECVFWFGPKIWNDPNSDEDEPWGSLDTAVELPEPDPIPESPLDDVVGGAPDNDLGWLEALWDLMKQLLGAIADLARAFADFVADLLSGLADLLVDLFVPDPDSWGLDGLMDQFEAKPPFSLLAPLAAEAQSFGDEFAGSGSCGILADFGDFEVSCSAVQNAPGMAMLYDVVRVGLFGLTAWSLFLLFGKLFQDQG